MFYPVLIMHDPKDFFYICIAVDLLVDTDENTNFFFFAEKFPFEVKMTSNQSNDRHLSLHETTNKN